MSKNNLIQAKSYQFALDSIKLYNSLKQKNEYTISKQFLRCATSIGANIEEAIGGHSRSDFYWKISIAYKEAREAHYWLRLLKDSKSLDLSTVKSYLKNSEELIRILGSIQKTLRENKTLPNS